MGGGREGVRERGERERERERESEREREAGQAFQTFPKVKVKVTE